MSTTPVKPRRTDSRTGAMPRIDVEPEIQHEPPQPPHLPEFSDDPGAITGIIPLAAEGEDEAKHADDSASLRV